MPQPDGLLFVQPEHGGKVHIGDDVYIDGAPDLVAEVAASSVSLDLGNKLTAYDRNGVQEYVVWRVFERQIDWFVHSDGGFERLLPGAAARATARRCGSLGLTKVPTTGDCRRERGRVGHRELTTSVAARTGGPSPHHHRPASDEAFHRRCSRRSPRRRKSDSGSLAGRSRHQHPASEPGSGSAAIAVATRSARNRRRGDVRPG